MSNSAFAAAYQQKFVFPRQSYELSDKSQQALKELISKLKEDARLGATIIDGSKGLRSSSLSYIIERNRALRIYQEIVRESVDPSRIRFENEKKNGEEITVALNENQTKSPIAVLPKEKGEREADNVFIILFDSSSAFPKFSSDARLQDFLASAGQPDRDAIMIEGYTDGIGNAAYNKALGELRALSVFELMVRKGLPPYRVETKSISKASEPGKGKENAVDRKVLVHWTQNTVIAARAAVIEKPVEPKAVEPEPAKPARIGR